MGSAASAKSSEKTQQVADATMLIIDQLKSVPTSERKELLTQLALLLGGDTNGDGVIDESELKQFISGFKGTGSAAVVEAAKSIEENSKTEESVPAEESAPTEEAAPVEEVAPVEVAPAEEAAPVEEEAPTLGEDATREATITGAESTPAEAETTPAAE